MFKYTRHVFLGGTASGKETLLNENRLKMCPRERTHENHKYFINDVIVQFFLLLYY